MFYLFLADGFEETEALATLDVMRRAKMDVVTVGVTGESVTGSHKVEVKADTTIDKIDTQAADGVVLPGGMPGTLNLSVIWGSSTEKPLPASRALSPSSGALIPQELALKPTVM